MVAAMQNLLRESEKWAYLESLRVFQAQLLKRYKNGDLVNFHVQIVMMSETGIIFDCYVNCVC